MINNLKCISNYMNKYKNIDGHLVPGEGKDPCELSQVNNIAANCIS